jgi:hypothetical protein
MKSNVEDRGVEHWFRENRWLWNPNREIPWMENAKKSKNDYNIVIVNKQFNYLSVVSFKQEPAW